MSDSLLQPSVGRLTFDAEGQEGGPFHSRRPHVPSDSSGVTIGRGYDMKHRSQAAVRDDLTAAGVDPDRAAVLCRAAGLEGEAARAFIASSDLADFEIGIEAQGRLFEIEYDRMVQDTRRLATKPDVVARYGPTDWDALHPVIREVLVDLRYRGDYTGTTRRFLQELVARNDLVAFAGVICDRRRWRRVPADRFRRRSDVCTRAVEMSEEEG